MKGMMKMISDLLLSQLRKKYPVGTRIRLLEMNDIQAPPIGTLGTVRGVDGIGSLLVSWDNGSHLNLVYGVDKCEIVNE